MIMNPVSNMVDRLCIKLGIKLDFSYSRSHKENIREKVEIISLGLKYISRESGQNQFFINEKIVVEGSYSLEVFLIYLIKTRFPVWKDLPKKTLFNRKGLKDIEINKIKYVYTKISDLKEYIDLVRIIDKEGYRITPIMKSESFSPDCYLDGSPVSKDSWSKGYIYIKENDIVELIDWEKGRESIVSTFFSLEAFSMSRVDRWIGVIPEEVINKKSMGEL
jgi:hypothetical protein